MLTNEIITLFPILEGLSKNGLNLINDLATENRIDTKTELIFKGDPVSGAYLVTAGSLRVYTIDLKGNETTLYTVLPGESCLLALNCVFSELRYPAWGSVDLVPTKLITIPSVIFKQLYSEEPAIRNFTFSVLSARIFDLMSTLEESMSLSMNQRLASFLIRTANHEGVVKMSHQDIASHLGTAREVISRLLKQFEKRGLLKLFRGSIRIISMQSLRNVHEIT
ncbi:MAG: Crp/Fnr family transcriptional regulator [Methylococcales bacterium]